MALVERYIQWLNFLLSFSTKLAQFYFSIHTQDHDGSFEPKVVKKRQKDISDIEQKIVSLYAKGMTTRQISETIEDIYGFEVSDGMVSDITDRLLPQIEDWQKRPLDEVYDSICRCSTLLSS